MKINGVEIETRKPTPIVFPRGPGQEPLIFFALPIPNLDEFSKLCPEPTPGQIYTRSGMQTDQASPQYVADMKTYRKRRWAYVVIKSLEPSNIAWARVNSANCETWLDYEADLQEVLGHYEYQALMRLVEDVNCLDPARMEVVLNDFFQKQAEANGRITPNSGLLSTPSGALASGSVSGPPT